MVALLSKGTLKEAAQECGLTEVTLWRYLQDPNFQKQYRASRRQTVEGAISKLQSTATKAAETLERNLECGEHGPENTAARTILEQAIKGVELLDLQERLERLEELMESQKGRKKWA